MKLILSRKGFDSEAGGVPSPILPDGRMISLPIPAQVGPKTYGDLLDKEVDVGHLVSGLTKGNIKPETPAHIDPDILKTNLHRRPGWLAAFGQDGAAQSHLARYNVGLGDIFLFFGWFRQVEGNNRCGWHYKRGAPDLHVLFGWMQVAEILNVGNNGDIFLKRYPWLVDHPHLNVKGSFKNTVYVASKALELPGCDVGDVSGAGSFDIIRKKLILTKAKQRNRSIWYLPSWFFPENNRPPLSYNKNLSKWQRDSNGVTLQSAGRGQEFVLDCNYYPEAFSWVEELLASGDPQKNRFW